MGERIWSIEFSAGLVLILSFVARAVGATMYWIRGGTRVPEYRSLIRGGVAADGRCPVAFTVRRSVCELTVK